MTNPITICIVPPRSLKRRLLLLPFYLNWFIHPFNPDYMICSFSIGCTIKRCVDERKRLFKHNALLPFRNLWCLHSWAAGVAYLMYTQLQTGPYNHFRVPFFKEMNYEMRGQHKLLHLCQWYSNFSQSLVSQLQKCTERNRKQCTHSISSKSKKQVMPPVKCRQKSFSGTTTLILIPVFFVPNVNQRKLGSVDSSLSPYCAFTSQLSSTACCLFGLSSIDSPNGAR